MGAHAGSGADVSYRASETPSVISGGSHHLRAWPWNDGDVVSRTEVHAKIGGSGTGGISPSKTTGTLQLFTSFGGEQFGYGHDGWRDDGSYHYTGAGQVRDQTMTRLNWHLLTSTRRIHIFKELPERKVYEYLGEFVRDENPEQAWYRDDATDRDGVMRTVIIFRLWPKGTNQPKLLEQPASPDDRSTFKKGRRERRHADGFVSATAEGQREAKRREAQLVEEYETWLVEQGHEVAGGQIERSGGRSSLHPDLYDVDADELVEAKATASRPDVRLALGQILDYARYAPEKRLAVLTPVRPEGDMVELLLSYGVSLAYRDEAGFERVEAVRRGLPVAT
ncbi:hypothetical protein [Saccharopolyspora sp. NPDC049426]|uniref:hypothetical protein n=1 Tax=Saccharopolyspora sp. NPDC049426 TaxID=3155652 RepID=UPI003438DB7F